jgi:flagellar hook-associated protein 2
VTGDGSFEINGVSISYAASDSVQTILDNINSSSAGVVASYSQATDQFSLTNSATGNMAITASDTSGTLLKSLGLTTAATTQAGANCEFTVNGGSTLTSTSNTLTASTTGITGLSVTATTTSADDNGPQVVNVASDTSNASTAINNFITSFNNVQTYIGAETAISTSTSGKVSTSDLSGYSDLTQMQSQLENAVFGAVPGLTGSIKMLNDIGIGFTGTSPTLSILDQTSLTSALTSNSSAVNTLFNGTGGLVSQLDKYVAEVTGTNGLLTGDMSALNTNNSDLASQVTRMQTQITASQTTMTAEYIAMESALSKIQSEESSLNSILNSTSSSSSSSTSSTASTSADMNLGTSNVSVSS